MISAAALALLGLLATPALAQLPRLDSATLSITASSSKASSSPDLAIDGNAGTPWRSQAGFPVELILDLGSPMAIDGLDYLSAPWLTRRGLNANAFEVAVAGGDAPPTDDNGWSTVADGNLAENPAKGSTEKVSFAETEGRFVRLRIGSSHGGAFTNAGEVGVFAASAGEPPVEPPVVPPAPSGEPCEDGFELATQVTNGEGELFCQSCGNNCASFGSVPEVFETTPGNNCPDAPVRLATPSSSESLGLNQARRDYADGKGTPYGPGRLPLNYDNTPNGGSFCILPTSAPIVIGGTVIFSDGCDVAPMAPDGSACCEIRFWQPNQNDLYFDYCTATVPVGPGGVYWAFTEVPGNEALASWGPDDKPHVHFEVNCAGCVATQAMPGGTYVGADNDAGSNKFYPLETCTKPPCNGPEAGPEHQATRFGDVVFKYDIIL